MIWKKQHLKIKLWRDISKNFEWQKVQVTMNFLNWGWGFDNQIPGIQELKDHAYRLFENVYGRLQSRSEDSAFIKCGGFEVRGYRNNHDKLHIELYFVLDSWDARQF